MTLNLSPYGPSGAAPGGFRGFQPLPSGGNVAPATDANAGAGGAAPAPTDPFNGPGSMSIDVTNPEQATQQVATQTSDTLRGLREWLFGSDQPNPATGQHTGILGDIPVVGDIGRGATNVLGAVGRPVLDALGGVTSLIGGTLERIPDPAANHAALVAAFESIPDSSPAKKLALRQMADDKGLFGTDILSPQDHFMSQAVVAYQTEKEGTAAPDLFQGLVRPAASLADLVTNLFTGTFGVGERVVERAVAGTGKSLTSDRSRAGEIYAVGSGQLSGFGTVWGTSDRVLTPLEQLVYENMSTGIWTENQANDFLASHGAGFAHNPALEVAATALLDPVNLVTFGGGALAKLGSTGARILDVLDAAKAELTAAKAVDVGLMSTEQAAAHAEQIAALEKSVQTFSEGGIKSGSAAETVAKRDILGKMATLSASGDIARGFGEFYRNAGLIGKVAKAVRTIVDPMHALGANPKAEQAIMEGSTQVAQAFANAYGPTHYTAVITNLGLDAGGQTMVDLFTEGHAIMAGNALRRVVGRAYLAAQVLGQRVEQLAAEHDVFKPLSDALQQVKRSALTQLEEEATRHIIYQWGPDAVNNLAQRAEKLWGMHTAEE
jgi:hypothetical protein